MEPPAMARGPASLSTQANALLRKNLLFQRRNWRANLRLTLYPAYCCILLIVLQVVINNLLNDPKNNCGCACVDTKGDGTCTKVCGIQYSNNDQVAKCPIPSPPRWPAVLQMPAPEFRAVKNSYMPFDDLPDPSCKDSRSCPATVLFTGRNRSIAEDISQFLFPSISSGINVSSYLSFLSQVVPGTDSYPGYSEFLESAFVSGPLYLLQPLCLPNYSSNFSFAVAGRTLHLDIKCVQSLLLWRDSLARVNSELYEGYKQSNIKQNVNEFVAAYDFQDTDRNNYNVYVSYNSTFNDNARLSPIKLVRTPRSINALSSAYLKFLRGSGVQMQLAFVKEMPKNATVLRLDFASLLGPLFFTWIVAQLLPVILNYLVYEKQQKLRIMMKMHGLNDGPYWIISYGYFFALSFSYVLIFVIFGSLIGLNFFRSNDYGIQFVFYFLYINLQIALAFLVAPLFSTAKAATLIAYIYVFASGLLGEYLLEYLVQYSYFPRGWLVVIELIPGFSLFRGLYELSQYAFNGLYMGTRGMQWSDLNDPENGMRDVFIVMAVEWVIFLVLALYLDQVSSMGVGIKKDPLFFLGKFKKTHPETSRKPIIEQPRSESDVHVDMERNDVLQEREVVEQLLSQNDTSLAIICDNLRKVYPGSDGNPEKLAVRGLSLALPQGQCFGLLGPNGAGKTSLISMLTGLIYPTSGTAYVNGMDIRTSMDAIYSNMGVCPQHDLLWETLTGREHLLFYGRLKNLKGAALTKAVEESLKSVNLFHGGVGDKQVRKYSGGMKRRLSVAISLIGDPKVVFLDEPGTGLDPASRNNLWKVVKEAKKDRAIILTTHSMEEAEVLCDRLSIVVDGELQCIGTPLELKARYGGMYVFTVTTDAVQEAAVESLVRGLSPDANRIYHISGTQKFELPKQSTRIDDVFRAVATAKSRFAIQAWGLADTTLEDVFIKVARGAQAFNALS